MEKYDKSALMKISKVLGKFNMLTDEECSDTVLISEWSNQFLDGR